MQAIPPGFVPFVINSDFVNFVGPLYHCRRDDAEVFGMRIERQHCNALEIAHGGLLATFADVLISRSVAVARGRTNGVVTVSLTTDFIAGVPLGSWLEGRATVDRVGSSMGFASCELRVDGGVAVRASGILKLLSIPFPENK